MATDPRFAAYLDQAGLPPELPRDEDTVTLQIGGRGLQLLYRPDEDLVSYAAALAGVGAVAPRRLAAFNANFLFGGGYGLFALPSGAGIAFQRRPRALVPPGRLVAELDRFAGLADRIEDWCRSAA